MPSVQIKNVPQDVHRVLRRRAAESGQSLQEYLRARLVAEARQPTLEEVLARASKRRGGSASLAAGVKAVRADRDAR
jgi:plasmid stability protein